VARLLGKQLYVVADGSRQLLAATLIALIL
jgi:hypothetical protein